MMMTHVLEALRISGSADRGQAPELFKEVHVFDPPLLLLLLRIRLDLRGAESKLEWEDRLRPIDKGEVVLPVALLRVV